MYFDYISMSLVFSEHNLNKLLIFDGFKYETTRLKTLNITKLIQGEFNYEVQL
jgi:hypothetical protein